ncbi:MAG: hypothetical protein EPO28_17250 [Saprospiraceae bacterium]|nr:MAG: hypothetical protein EPO28_17250 [Saprospiraceae bacterium]
MKAFVPWQRKDWIERIKSIPGRAWNEQEKYWSLPLSKSVALQLKEWLGEQVRFSFDLPSDIPGDYLPKNWKPGLSANFKIVEAGTEMATSPPPVQKPAHTAQRENVVVARRSPGEDRMVFLQVPAGEKEWIASVKKIPGSTWLSSDRLWAVPGTQENFDACKAYFGEKLVVDKDMPVPLSNLPAINAVKMPSFATVNTNQPPNPANALHAQPCFQNIEKNGVAIKAVIGESLIVQQLNSGSCRFSVKAKRGLGGGCAAPKTLLAFTLNLHEPKM